MLGFGIVDRNQRTLQNAVFFHASQANHSGGGFLCTSYHALQELLAGSVKGGDQIRSVIHGDVWLHVQRTIDVLIIDPVGLALDGENGYIVILNQRCGHVILGG